MRRNHETKTNACTHRFAPLNTFHVLRPAGTLPPRFTQPTHRYHNYLQTSAARSEVTSPGVRRTTTAEARGAITLFPPRNNGSRPKSFAPVRTSGNLISRKRPRTSPYPYVRHNVDDPSSSDPLPESRATTPAYPGRIVINNGTDRSNGGSLWGANGGPPTGVENPNTSGMPLETEWACPSSSGATSTPSLHDGFSDVGSYTIDQYWLH